MTFDLTKFLPRFAKCPELRPESLRWYHGLWQVDAGECEGDWSPCPGRAQSHLAAALIRDKATWWLLNRGEDFGISGGGPGRAWIFEWGDHEVGRTLADADPTEALYLACCHVLEIDP